jgi:cell division protein FtsI/penicillin-binding protein 2
LLRSTTKTTKKSRLTWVKGGALALFGLAAFSQAKVQLIDRGDTLDRARGTKKFQISDIDHAKRGVIFSADGKPLAQDQDTYVLSLQFQRVPQSDGFFVALSAATAVPASEFSSLAAAGVVRKQWLDPISAEQAKAVAAVKSKWRADGLSLVPTGRRAYALGEAGAGIIGAMRERTPINGLERSLDSILAGEDGKTIGVVDRTGNFLPMRTEDSSVRRIDGQDVYLTIDTDMQAVAAAAIKEAVEKSKADSGVAIVTDPYTGDILAMANWPSFDPVSLQGPKGGRVAADTNPNYMSRLDPGSMMKILTLAKALDCGAVRPSDHMQCSGTFQVTPKGKPVKCDIHHGNRAHGDLTLDAAIAKSCNVSAARWAIKVGYEDFVSYIEQLGLLKRVDVGLPFEAAGSFNYNDPAKQLQLACVGFGQSIGVPPISLAGAFTALANDGVRMEPRLIRQIGSQSIPPKPAGRMFQAETAHRVMDYMESVVESESGTGYKLRIPGYRLAGKTGTAQRIGRPDGGYVANFVGYVPAGKPRAQILVMVDRPTAGGYYGATVAGPVFVKIARSVIRRYNIQPTEAVTSSEGAAKHS